MGLFDGKVFLELGTNVASVDIVQYAKSEGAYVIVTDYLPEEKSEAKKYADETYMISTLDTDLLVELIKAKRVDGVFCGVSEVNLKSVRLLAEKTGFTEEDAEKIHEALETLFENDCSSARPEGSMEVRRVFWYRHDSKTPKNSSAKVHRLLKVNLKEGIDRPRCFEDYDITVGSLDGLTPEIFRG